MMTRKEKGEVHFKLIDILTDCETDKDYYNRLMYAKKLIEKELKEFKLNESIHEKY